MHFWKENVFNSITRNNFWRQRLFRHVYIYHAWARKWPPCCSVWVPPRLCPVLALEALPILPSVAQRPPPSWNCPDRPLNFILTCLRTLLSFSVCHKCWRICLFPPTSQYIPWRFLCCPSPLTHRVLPHCPEQALVICHTDLRIAQLVTGFF